MTAHGLTGSRGHRRAQPPWGGCFRTAFTIQALTGKQSSCSSKDTNLSHPINGLTLTVKFFDEIF